MSLDFGLCVKIGTRRKKGAIVFSRTFSSENRKIDIDACATFNNRLPKLKPKLGCRYVMKALNNLFESLLSISLSQAHLRYFGYFDSISSNRNRGSFDSEELRPSKWYRCGRKNPVSSTEPRFRGEEFESK